MEEKRFVLMPFCIEAVLMFHKLKRESINIEGFFDNNIRLSHEAYNNIQIMLPYYTHDVRIIICSDKYYNDMERQLLEFSYNREDVYDWRKINTKYNNVDICNDIDLETYQRISPYEAFYDKDDIGRNGTIIVKELRAFSKVSPNFSDGIDSYHTIPFFDFSQCGAVLPEIPHHRDTTASPLFTVDNCDLKITDVCTLRCKFCSVLLDYPIKRKAFDVTKVLDTFHSFIRKIDFARRMTLLGGEPFTYGDLSTILRYMIEHEEFQNKIGIMYLYTNATILPNDEVCSLLHQVGVFVVISNYTTVNTKIMDFVKKMNQFHIRYWIGKMDENWFDMNSIVPYKNAERKSSLCNATNCPEIENGKFYKCAFLLQAEKLGAIPYDKRNFIEISSITKESLNRYRQSFTPGCGWCKGRDLEQWKSERVCAGHQLSKPRTYEKYSES